ncbi:MAG TPA: phosphonoacetaldehyde hydrolase [Dehalococcoidia bacterium]|jgi:phosphonoacetaldehyde hydrolase|nr:phosphonoacetaldehyde hydrolase [Dehalococcoidia bacterium]
MAREAAAGRHAGPLKAVILDWAGTVVDYGSCAPAGVFVEVFARHGVPITMAQARAPMGSEKRAHIAAIAATPEVAEAWQREHGGPCTEDDIDSMYREFIPLQIESLPRFADLIPGTTEAVAEFRKRGLKIGTTTGYNAEMMRVLAAEASRRGFEPDCIVSSDMVPEGRPAPWMALKAAALMRVYPMSAIVKVGDTIPDILEGLNAGMWTVAVAGTGNEMGLSQTEYDSLPAIDREQRLDSAYERLRDAGAHYVIDSIANVPPVLDEIEARLVKGERP